MNNRDKIFTNGKVERRRKQLEESVSRYLSQLDTANLQDPSETLDAEEGADQGETGEAEIGDG